MWRLAYSTGPCPCSTARTCHVPWEGVTIMGRCAVTRNHSEVATCTRHAAAEVQGTIALPLEPTSLKSPVLSLTWTPILSARDVTNVSQLCFTSFDCEAVRLLSDPCRAQQILFHVSISTFRSLKWSGRYRDMNQEDNDQKQLPMR